MAVDEAVSRGAPLRLIHMIEPGSEAFRLETEYAQIVLRTAVTAVEATGRHANVETAIQWRNINVVLDQESRSAELVCIGSPARDTSRRGCAALPLLRWPAHCPVAVISSRSQEARSKTGCVAVVGDDSPTSDKVLQEALDEARRRMAPLLAMDVRRQTTDLPRHDPFAHRMAQWLLRYPDVDVDVRYISVHTDVVEFLAKIDRSVLMIIVNNADQDEVARLACPTRGRPALHQPPLFDPDDLAVTPAVQARHAPAPISRGERPPALATALILEHRFVRAEPNSPSGRPIFEDPDRRRPRSAPRAVRW